MKVTNKFTFNIFIITFLSIFCMKALAQDTTKYVTFMGFVYDINNRPIPGAVIQNITRKKAVATELSGKFLMVVAPNDVIHVRLIGYKDVNITIPANITTNYVRSITLQVDTFMLGTVNVKAYPTAKEMFEAEIKMNEVSENAGFVKLDHAPIIKAPNPLTSPLSAISNAVQKKRMQNGKGKIDAYHQSLMIKDFYKDGASAVPDSVSNLYNK